MYEAVKEQNFQRADSLKEKISALKEEISHLSKIPQTVIVEDNMREEKNDTATMVKCLDILYVATQSASVLTPTLRNLLNMVLDSLDVSMHRYLLQYVCVGARACILKNCIVFYAFIYCHLLRFNLILAF